MKVIEVGMEPIIDATRIVLVIGKFDGVHLGHQRILSAAKRAVSSHCGAQLAVMSFWPHPAHVLRGKPGYDRALTPFSEKCRELEAMGVDRLLRVQFSAEFASIPAQAFVEDYLSNLALAEIVVGEDFRFGHGGVGDARLLARLMHDRGVAVQVISAVEGSDGQKVSSSEIRVHLANGDIEAANALLGRPYAISGVVVHGDARGRTIGFPTANLSLSENYVLPKDGVYVIRSVTLDDDIQPSTEYYGILNAGTRPTVNGSEFRIEAHLFDFDADLYGRSLRVSFLHRIRDERRFESIDALRNQISEDALLARRFLEKETLWVKN